MTVFPPTSLIRTLHLVVAGMIVLMFGIEGVLLHYIGTLQQEEQWVIARIEERGGREVAVQDTLILFAGREVKALVSHLLHTCEWLQREVQARQFSIFAFLPMFNTRQEWVLPVTATFLPDAPAHHNRLMRLMAHVRDVFHPPRR